MKLKKPKFGAEILKNLHTLLNGLHEVSAELMKKDGEFPTTYILFKENGEPVHKLNEKQMIDSGIKDPAFGKLAAMMGIDVDDPDDMEGVGKAAHRASIIFVRNYLQYHEDIHYLAILGEVWVTAAREGDPENGEDEIVREEHRWEAMHFIVHHRSGEFLVATQDLVRPAGQPPEYFGPLNIETGVGNHTGELCTMFPCQLKQH